MTRSKYVSNSEILAVYSEGGKKGTLYVPAGSIIFADTKPDDSPLIKVSWDGRKLQMFFEDLERRGRLLPERVTVSGDEGAERLQQFSPACTRCENPKEARLIARPKSADNHDDLRSTGLGSDHDSSDLPAALLFRALGASK